MPYFLPFSWLMHYSWSSVLLRIWYLGTKEWVWFVSKKSNLQSIITLHHVSSLFFSTVRSDWTLLCCKRVPQTHFLLPRSCCKFQFSANVTQSVIMLIQGLRNLALLCKWSIVFTAERSFLIWSYVAVNEGIFTCLKFTLHIASYLLCISKLSNLLTSEISPIKGALNMRIWLLVNSLETNLFKLLLFQKALYWFSRMAAILSPWGDPRNCRSL